MSVILIVIVIFMGFMGSFNNIHSTGYYLVMAVLFILAGILQLVEQKHS